MDERPTVFCDSEWSLKEYILTDQQEPRPIVNAVFCLLHAEQAAGRWTLEFIDQVFARDFDSAQRLFTAMSKGQRRRFVVSLMPRYIDDNERTGRPPMYVPGRCYLVQDIYALQISPLGGTFGHVRNEPRFVYRAPPADYLY